MNADSKRDTLRGVGEGSPCPEDEDREKSSSESVPPRLKQAEFTVPPQIWKRPSTGWFAKFARDEGAESLDDERPVDDASTETAALARSPKRRPARLPLALFCVVLTALASVAAWRLLASGGSRRASTEPRIVIETGKPTTASVPPSVPLQAASSPKPPIASTAVELPSTSSSAVPSKPALRTPAMETAKSGMPATPKTAPKPAPSDTLGPIY